MPSAHAIKTSANNCEETGSTVKKKGSSVKTVHTPKNIDAVRASFEQSPLRSAVRHSKKPGLSESTSNIQRNEAADTGINFKNPGRRVT